MRAVVTKLVEVWEWFDFACGQRLVAALRTEVPRLRAAGQLKCSDEVAKKLMKISAHAVDRLLKREKQIQRVNRPRSVRVHPLLYQKIPVKVAAESGYQSGQQCPSGLCRALRALQRRAIPAHGVGSRYRDGMVGGRSDPGPHAGSHARGAGSNPETRAVWTA